MKTHSKNNSLFQRNWGHKTHVFLEFSHKHSEFSIDSILGLCSDKKWISCQMVMAHTFNPSAWAAEGGSRPASLQTQRFACLSLQTLPLPNVDVSSISGTMTRIQGLRCSTRICTLYSRSIGVNSLVSLHKIVRLK